MTRDNCWLPKLEFWDDYNNDYPQYQGALYEIFQNDFIKSRPTFEGKQVNIRKHPIEYGKEEAFFHVTCQDYLKTENVCRILEDARESDGFVRLSRIIIVI